MPTKINGIKRKGVILSEAKGRVEGSQQDLSPEQIYQQYLKAYKKGVFNYIKEDTDPVTQHMIPRKYFSGGFGENPAMLRTETELAGPTEKAALAPTAQAGYFDFATVANPNAAPTPANAAMSAEENRVIDLMMHEINPGNHISVVVDGHQHEALAVTPKGFDQRLVPILRHLIDEFSMYYSINWHKKSELVEDGERWGLIVKDSSPHTFSLLTGILPGWLYTYRKQHNEAIESPILQLLQGNIARWDYTPIKSDRIVAELSEIFSDGSLEDFEIAAKAELSRDVFAKVITSQGSISSARAVEEMAGYRLFKANMAGEKIFFMVKTVSAAMNVRAIKRVAKSIASAMFDDYRTNGGKIRYVNNDRFKTLLINNPDNTEIIWMAWLDYWKVRARMDQVKPDILGIVRQLPVPAGPYLVNLLEKEVVLWERNKSSLRYWQVVNIFENMVHVLCEGYAPVFSGSNYEVAKSRGRLGKAYLYLTGDTYRALTTKTIPIDPEKLLLVDEAGSMGLDKSSNLGGWWQLRKFAYAHEGITLSQFLKMDRVKIRQSMDEVSDEYFDEIMRAAQNRYDVLKAAARARKDLERVVYVPRATALFNDIKRNKPASFGQREIAAKTIMAVIFNTLMGSGGVQWAEDWFHEFGLDFRDFNTRSSIGIVAALLGNIISARKIFDDIGIHKDEYKSISIKQMSIVIAAAVLNGDLKQAQDLFSFVQKEHPGEDEQTIGVLTIVASLLGGRNENVEKAWHISRVLMGWEKREVTVRETSIMIATALSGGSSANLKSAVQTFDSIPGTPMKKAAILLTESLLYYKFDRTNVANHRAAPAASAAMKAIGMKMVSDKFTFAGETYSYANDIEKIRELYYALAEFRFLLAWSTRIKVSKGALISKFQDFFARDKGYFRKSGHVYVLTTPINDQIQTYQFHTPSRRVTPEIAALIMKEWGIAGLTDREVSFASASNSCLLVKYWLDQTLSVMRKKLGPLSDTYRKSFQGHEPSIKESANVKDDEVGRLPLMRFDLDMDLSSPAGIRLGIFLRHDPTITFYRFFTTDRRTLRSKIGAPDEELGEIRGAVFEKHHELEDIASEENLAKVPTGKSAAMTVNWAVLDEIKNTFKFVAARTEPLSTEILAEEFNSQVGSRVKLSVQSVAEGMEELPEDAFIIGTKGLITRDDLKTIAADKNNMIFTVRLKVERKDLPFLAVVPRGTAGDIVRSALKSIKSEIEKCDTRIREFGNWSDAKRYESREQLSLDRVYWLDELREKVEVLANLGEPEDPDVLKVLHIFLNPNPVPSKIEFWRTGQIFVTVGPKVVKLPIARKNSDRWKEWIEAYPDLRLEELVKLTLADNNYFIEGVEIQDTTPEGAPIQGTAAAIIHPAGQDLAMINGRERDIAYVEDLLKKTLPKYNYKGEEPKEIIRDLQEVFEFEKVDGFKISGYETVLNNNGEPVLISSKEYSGRYAPSFAANLQSQRKMWFQISYQGKMIPFIVLGRSGMMAPLKTADQAQIVNGGIDLTTQNGFKVEKDANGGVKFVTQSKELGLLIGRIRRDGVYSVVPVIVRVSSMPSVLPALGLSSVPQ